MMNVLKKILYFTSGYYGTWIGNYMQIQGILWYKTKGISDHNERAIAELTLQASLMLIEEFIGPEHDNSIYSFKLSKKRINNMHPDDILESVAIINQLFLDLISEKNRKVDNYKNDILVQLYGAKYELAPSSGIQSADDLKIIIFDYLDRFIEATKVIQHNDPSLSLRFFIYITETSKFLGIKLS